MPEETSGIDHYEAVLADLHTKRDQIDQAIAAIESLRSGTSPSGQRSKPAGSQNGTKGATGPDAGGPGALLGMSISDAAKHLLAAKRTTLKNNDFATMFKAGGLHLNSKDWVNTIGAVLTRRCNEVGDIVKVDRGTWGLKEWYPGRSFKKEKDEAKADAPKEASSETPKKPNMFSGTIVRKKVRPSEDETSGTGKP